MKIAGLHKLSLIDYPDKVAATLFLAGCNLNCGYCYNRWMINAAHVEEAMTPDALLAWLNKRRGLIDGICVSGGEPTLQPDLAPLLRSIKALGLAVKLDTNGTQPTCVAELLGEGLLDYVALDLKAPFDERYGRVAGCAVDLAAICQSLQLLRARSVAYELRTTAGPLIDEQALLDLSYEIQETETWFIQPFVRAQGIDPSLFHAQALSADALRSIVTRLSERLPHVRLRGEG